MAETPPGPKGEPLFGSSRTYASDPFRFISALESAYGDVAYFDMGPMETVMLSDPTAIERVLVSEADRFRKPDFQGDALGDLLGEGLLLSEGDTWETQRQLANPAFSMRRLAGMADRITGHAEDRLADWADGDVVNVERAMTRTTLDVILDLMMGVELSEARVETIEEQLMPLGQRFEPDPLRFAAPEWMPMPDDAEFDAAVETLDSILDDIIAVRERTAGSGEDGPMDFLSVLIRARDDGVESPEQLRDEMMTMLLAGHDTTALTLTYTWFLLSEHPEVERRVHEELDEVVGDDRPGMEHVRRLDYLEWVIQESMRLYPPVYVLFREPTEPVELSGYPVEQGMTLMLPQWGVHRSERFYDDPETFDPERWRPERAKERPRFAYFPFGGGPRHCIGKHLAMLEAQLIVAATAQRYELDFLGETPLELMPSLTAHPRQEMSMRVESRE
ncbi:cytochrome P450 [Haloarcula onubensis]|uniref:Cytochrome P450 n=1 Tax=Haloarcula onubensis TaxID=2950539 RepID=A0ABU2FQU5_9EURY|nr:cytochrome P450 [Halomicroarcula sp. S3CR25-11]MDS0283130.1 cytochrome P450 [Halomicroarcula sp. S3CR25-11]